jgi:hypothetical protein
MRYLFWNTGKKRINTIIHDLIVKYRCNIIGLAEYSDDMNELLTKLSLSGLQYYSVDKIGCARIDILTSFTPGKVETFGESTYYTVRKFPHEKLGFHLVTFVHLPSKLHTDDIDYIYMSQDLKGDIKEAEQITQLTASIIVGDFNMNPFESAMVAAGSLHSVPCKQIASSGSRKIKGESYSMFYNPMWNLFGDISKPPGTYFYNKSTHLNYYWNMFDQVLIRPNLCSRFVPTSLEIITGVGDTDLISGSGRPCVSDHLPIRFEIE